MTSGSAINDHGVLTQKVDSQMLPDDVKELQAELEFDVEMAKTEVKNFVGQQVHDHEVNMAFIEKLPDISKVMNENSS